MHSVIPTAFLDLDLVLVKVNTAFQQLIGGTQDISGVRLSDIAKPAEGDSFQNARNRLREEREAKDPSYLPPILRGGVDPVSGITDANVDEVTRGFADQHYSWTFRLATGTEQILQIRVRLAKTSHYFVTLLLPPLPSAQTLTEQISPTVHGITTPAFAAPPLNLPHLQATTPYLGPSHRARSSISHSSPPSPFFPYQGVGHRPTAAIPVPSTHAAVPASTIFHVPISSTFTKWFNPTTDNRKNTSDRIWIHSTIPPIISTTSTKIRYHGFTWFAYRSPKGRQRGNIPSSNAIFSAESATAPHKDIFFRIRGIGYGGESEEAQENGD
ncbi:hypothetical protein MBLNU459_g2865t2 [Dothideomycetes sp. NU459]